MSEIIYWVWMSALRGLGSRGAAKLLEHFGTPAEVYRQSSRSSGRIPGLTQRQSDLLQSSDLTGAENILRSCVKKGIDILTREDEDYPQRLSQIYDPPILLYVRGRIPPIDSLPVIAVVGTRKASTYGLRMARQLGTQLSAGGAAVCTGMALGVDGAAAEGALTAGACIGVLGTAIDVDYPSENAALIRETAERGCILSEYPPGWRRANFPRRNRIISGLSCGVCVVEAPEKSGALITADFALEQGRDLFVLPGNADNPSCAGSNGLLREGVRAVTCAEDILQEYRGLFSLSPRRVRREEPLCPPKTEIDKAEPIAYIDLESRTQGCSREQLQLLQLLQNGEKTADELIGASGLSAAKVLAELTLLSIRGLISAKPGKRYSLK